MGNVARRVRASSGSAAGFTLVELCSSLMIFGILSAIGVTTLHSWTAGSRHTATTSALEALLRQTQQRAVTEGRTLCIDFDLAAQSWSVLRGSCTGTGQVLIDGPIRVEDGVRIASATFAAGASTIDGITFYPRGTATPGSITITREGSDRVDTLTVEGLTGRVARD
ncbi:GspH/FimT family pseudopilin [Sporichthya polymorpha]|uniref:GspH/FimT family pseudopilin n=1 Tax=Sporichthya polymorpha TaxID=35751 RepID=UPI00036232FD|nr:GspH/FimT family pseudopilin [Sporichthya polymorpha]